MTEYKFSDVKVGDRVVVTKGSSRAEFDVTNVDADFLAGDEFWIGTAWTVADITKVLPTDPGARINNVTAHETSWEFAVRGYAKDDLSLPWALFDTSGEIEFADDDDITSWENA